MRVILVPVDGSPLAETALPTAIALARRTAATRVDAVIVVPEAADPLATSGAPVADARLDHDLRVESERYAAALRLRLPQMAQDVATGVTLLHGRPVERLATRVLAGGHDLIVMTTHGRSGISRAWLGSVADGLLRSTLTPLLLLRDVSAAAPPANAGSFATVVIPIDDGSVSEEIIADALAVAGPEATYHLVHVVVPVRWLPPPSAFEVVTAGSADAADAVDSADTAERLSAKRDAAVRHVAAVAERLRAHGVQVRTHIPVHQSPAEAILAYAHECGASLIAMTSHGRGATARLLIGSVADKVVRGATVPVLVRVPAHR